MPQHPHTEKHFTGSKTLRDIVIGMADGLTVPFALAAGLSGITDQSKLIITAGLAEIAAGAIAMGLGGYLAARTDAEHFQAERKREDREIDEKPEAEATEVEEILMEHGLTQEEATRVTNAMRKDRKRWLDFMMRFELGLEEPDRSRAAISAITIGGSYIVGGLIPLAPYFFPGTVERAMVWSVAMTLVALAVFGYIKGKFTTGRPMRSAIQTTLVGGLAAAAAYTLASLFHH